MGASALEQGGFAPAAVREPRLVVFAVVAVAGGWAAGCSLALALTNDSISKDLGQPLVIALLSVWITLSYVLCGLLAWWHRPASRFGPLLIAAGLGNFLATLSWATSSGLFTLGQMLDLVPPVLFLHLFVAFPSGRLQKGFERNLVVTGYALAVGLEVVRMTLGGFGPHNLLELAPNPDAALAVLRVQLTLVSAYCLAGVGVLVVRRRRRGRPLRRPLALIADVFGLALVLIALLLLSAAWGGPAVEQIRWATFAALGLTPVAFLIALLHARLARSSAAELFVDLQANPERADLQDALARALRDPSLTLAYWLPEFASYADTNGRAVTLPGEDDRRSLTLIGRDGAPVAALLHDPALDEEPELLNAVTAGAGLALENERLHVELRARLEELRGSRARIVDAGQSERQRLERNLHDGAQQRLIALSLELGLLEARLDGDPDAKARLAEARGEIATSLEELRAVARGIHPAVVSGHGLAVALEQLAARAAVPVKLSVRVAGRLPERLEVAAFYLVSESLANVAKHAWASSASVDVARGEGQVLVEVVDDGIGGADTEVGTGLRGLADRVEALGGRLQVWSPRGGGTRLRAEIPCEP